MMRAGSQVIAAVLACALAGGCSSGSAPAHRTSDLPSTTTGGERSDSPSTATGAAAVQAYLDAVNKLCDALLPKVIAVTNGGSLDIPLRDFFKQLPAHQKLRDDFDRKLAQVPVPPAARDKAQALDDYIHFANQLDAKRLAAAKKGRAAYAKEIRDEQASAANDPSITARNAAGFNESCDAR
jgi:hypothetical protein